MAAMTISSHFTTETDNQTVAFALKSRRFALTTMEKKCTQKKAAKAIGISTPAFINAERGVMGPTVKKACVKWLNRKVVYGQRP